jgi:hypothetical protein
MEAFGELTSALGWTASPVEWPAVKALFKLLDIHAHELAQQIREHNYDPGEVGPVHLAFETAADLIDPEERA